jgi:hypothetical protein
MSDTYHDHLFPHDDPRLVGIRGLDPYAYRGSAWADPFTGGLLRGWAPLYPSEFAGITTDGSVVPGLFPLTDVPAEEAAPTATMVAAADAFLATLSPEEAARIRYPIDAPEWQSWSNPEFMIHDTGIRLEFLSAASRAAALELVRASLSPAGFEQYRTLQRINGWLGEIVDIPTIMNEFSYHFAVYGEPALTEPWGWQLFGHHLATNCLVWGPRYNLTPTFLAAEPNEIDSGPHQGSTSFVRRLALARALTASLTSGQRAAIQVYPDLVASLPPGRVDPGDERHLGGAFQDNRIVPYEGSPIVGWSEESKRILGDLVAETILQWSEGPRRRRLRQIEDHYGETWFAWYGGFGPDDPFYYRIQSPVAFFELDHHCGVFLSNRTPAIFHIHTVDRTPNGNDYGKAWLAEPRK